MKTLFSRKTDDRSDPLFDDEFMKILERLHLIASKIFSGQMKADRRSRHKGVSNEFADYRRYAPGDDFRFIDWSIFFRTENLFLKLFEEERDLHIYLLVDCSNSMDFGQPYKFHYARRLAAAIGYMGLARLDQVEVIPFSSAVPTASTDVLRVRGRGKISQLLEFLTARSTDGVTNMRTAMKSFAAGKHKQGLAIVISDLFDTEGVTDALNFLRVQKFDPYAIHVVSPQDVRPELLGDIQLVDCETRRLRDVTVNESILRAYSSKFEAYCERIETFCRSKEIGYVRCTTDVPFEDTVVHMLRRGRLLQ